MRHRRFADRAGFTRHCWECAHARGWQDGTAWCARHGMTVGRYDSPNNGSSVAGKCYDYEDAREGRSELI